MPYPWASLGSFYFARDESALFGTDTGWNRTPSVDRTRPLGSAIDSIVTLAIGSAMRSFECHLSPDRFATLEALINTVAAFTDWDRPTPDSRQAFLQRVSQVSWIASLCEDGITQKRIRTRVELVSQ